MIEWSHVAVIVIANFVFTLWLKSGHREVHRNSTREMRYAFEAESMKFRCDLQHEIKDIHGRLCTIEERNKFKMRVPRESLAERVDV